MAALAAAQGDRAEVTAAPDSGGLMVRQQGLTLLRGIPHPHPAMLEAWNQLLVGALAVHDRFAPALQPWPRARADLASAGRGVIIAPA